MRIQLVSSEESEFVSPEIEILELSSEDFFWEPFENLFANEVAKQSLIESRVEAPFYPLLKFHQNFLIWLTFVGYNWEVFRPNLHQFQLEFAKFF